MRENNLHLIFRFSYPITTTKSGWSIFFHDIKYHVQYVIVRCVTYLDMTESDIVGQDMEHNC